MNIPIVSLEGYEADDVMGTLAVLASSEGFLTTIISGDKDLLQLAAENIKIRIPKGSSATEDYFAADFIEKMGITPSQYIEMKALMGDASDNIPGIAGIGEKTALKIIQDFKSIEAAIEAVDNDTNSIKPKKAAENLKQNADMARLSKELVTIATNAPIAVDLESLTLGEMFNEAALEEFKRLELKSLLKKFEKPSPAQLLSGTQLLGEFSITIMGIALSEDKTPAFTPITELSDFENNKPKVVYDAKRIIHLLKENNMKMNNLIFDIHIADCLLNHNSGMTSPTTAEAFYDSYLEMSKMLKSQGMDKLFYEVEMPLISVLADMEFHGITIDTKFIKKYGQKLSTEIERLTAEIYKLAGYEFNINSTKQLAKVLFEDMGLRSGKRTKTGFSTNVEVLQKLARNLPEASTGQVIAAKILEYRSHTKLRSTYTDGLLAAINPTTGKVHTTFNQALTSTGRLSSNDPNLQNIPIRTTLGRELRRAFVASPGFIFVDADYNQIELRILAELSQDETFLDAFAQNLDIHRITAGRVFHVPFEFVDDQMRSYAKAVNFGIVYGISAFSLAEDIGVSVREAEGFIQSYFTRYPRVKAFMDKTVREAKLKGYAETLWGRRRALPELTAGNFVTRGFGERAAMNMPVQGSAADIIKIAMVKVFNRLQSENLKSRLILQIHDELLIEAHEAEVEQVSGILKSEMENAVKLSVPLTIDINIGKNWYDAK
jgi:DNA polymerase-1